MPLYVNPAEFLLSITSTDFAESDDGAQQSLDTIHADWKASEAASNISASIQETSQNHRGDPEILVRSHSGANSFQVILALVHRSFIKSYRDVVAYGIRFAMYVGLAIMMGTVWLRLPPTQSSIQPFINAIVGPKLIIKKE